MDATQLKELLDGIGDYLDERLAPLERLPRAATRSGALFDLNGMDSTSFAFIVMKNVREYVQPALDALASEMRQELAKFSEKQVTFRGIWQSGENYKRGDLVTRAGSAFVACDDSRGIDPEDHEGTGSWQLFAKRGRDGRDRNART